MCTDNPVQAEKWNESLRSIFNTIFLFFFLKSIHCAVNPSLPFKSNLVRHHRHCQI